MDIFTHSSIGLIAAAPLLDSQPELALGFVAGSVLPDLDSLARIFGKRAFLQAHQTWSHAIPVQLAFSGLAGCCAAGLGIDGLILGAGLLAGMVLHTLLDFTNTLGVTLLAPFSRQRYCCECVFFIDAFVLALTSVALALTAMSVIRNGVAAPQIAVGCFITLIGYVFGKAILRHRAGLVAGQTLCLIPSALWPWRFFGVTGAQRVQLFQINALTARRIVLQKLEVLDDCYTPLLLDIPEFRVMKDLSPAYHVVGATKTEAGEMVLCRDLRTRNFNTRFGDLEVLVRPGGNVQLVEFHV